jgi:hypothetical protein
VSVEEAIQRFIEQLAKDFKVVKPNLLLLPTKEVWSLCESEAIGCYNSELDTIILSRDFLTEETLEGFLETLLHEFRHYMQEVVPELERYREVEPEEFDKPHCKRSFERDAKVFASIHSHVYMEKWRQLMEPVLKYAR